MAGSSCSDDPTRFKLSFVFTILFFKQNKLERNLHTIKYIDLKCTPVNFYTQNYRSDQDTEFLGPHKSLFCATVVNNSLRVTTMLTSITTFRLSYLDFI